MFVPDQQYKINNDILLANLVGSHESYIVNIDQQSHISLPGNVSLTFPENKVRQYDNTAVTGQIKIDFKEYAYPKVGLMNYPEASTNHTWINTEKAIFLKITQDGHEVILKEPITLYFPNITPHEDIKVYTQNGENINTQWDISSVLTNELEYGNWLVNAGNEQQLNEISGYKLKITQGTDRILIGKTLGEKGELKTRCIVDTPNGFTNYNTMVYFVGNQTNMIVRLDYDDIKKQFYTIKRIADQQIEGKMVMISQISDDEYYFGTTNAVLGEDIRISLSGSIMPLQNIKAALSKL